MNIFKPFNKLIQKTREIMNHENPSPEISENHVDENATQNGAGGATVTETDSATDTTVSEEPAINPVPEVETVPEVTPEQEGADKTSRPGQPD